MNGSTNSILASRVRGLGKELLAIAAQLDAQAPHLSVNLPRDLFSDLEDLDRGGFVRETNDREGILVERGHGDVVEESTFRPYDEQAKPKRTYHRNGKRMEEVSIVETDKRVGKAEGFCNRNDIERTIVRITGRNREDVREAVNRVAGRMLLVCVRSRSYRYYQRSQRDAIINAACLELERI
jgi:hypothetical protein